MAKKAKKKSTSKGRKSTAPKQPAIDSEELSVDRATIPNFAVLGPEKFQDFCMELFHTEPGIATSDIYGPKGQKQFGIDIKAVRINGEGLELGQCKAYREITATDIKQASADFLEHWDSKWKEKNVRRFILFIACPLTRTELQDQVDEEAKVFKKIGVNYEAWSATTISQKIKPHRIIAQRFLDDPWPERLCGSPSTVGLKDSSERYSRTVLDAMNVQIESWATDSSEQYIKEWKAEFKKGLGKEVYQKLLQLKGNSSKWTQIPDPTKAKILRLECRFLLSLERHKGDLIRSLSFEANQLAGNNKDLCLEALIAGQIDNNRKKALEILSKPENSEESSLRAAFLIEEGLYGDAKEILAGLENNSNNSEKIRLEAYLSLIERDFETGLSKIAAASSEIAELPGIQGVKAKLLYYSAYSPGVLTSPAVSYPMPIHRSLLRSGEQTKAALIQAEKIFEGLFRKLDGEIKSEYALWYFATICLNDQSSKDSELVATELAPTLFSNSVFISWSMSRRLSSAIDQASHLLDKNIADGLADIYTVTSRLLIHTSKNEFHLASRLLKASSHVFGEDDQEKLEYWKTEIDILKAKTVTAIKKISKRDLSPTLKIQLVEKWFRINPADPDIHRFIKNATDVKIYPSFLLFAAEISYKQEEWQFIIDNAADILDNFPNKDTLELIADACFKAGRFDMVLKFLKDDDALLSLNLKKLRAHAEKMTGNYADAIKFSEENLRQEMNEDSLLYLSNILISKGDFNSLKKYVDEYKAKISISVENKILLASWLAVDFPDTSRILVQEILKQKIKDDLVPSVLTLAFELGLDILTNDLMKRMQKISEKNGSLVRIVDTQQLLKVIAERHNNFLKNRKLFENVEIPIHLFAAVQGFPIANYINLNLKANEQQNSFFKKSPIYARYGGRPFSFPSDIKFHSVCLDITSLLFLDYFGLLPAVEQAFNAIEIPHNTLLLLSDNRRRLRPNQKTRIDSKQKILELCQSGALKRFKKIASTHSLSLKEQEELGSDFSTYADFVKERSGYLLVFDPLQASIIVQDNDNLKFTKDRLIGLGDLAGIITNEISFSELEKRDLLGKLGRYADEKTETSPVRSSVIIFSENTAEVLQTCGLLDKVTTYFDCWISDEEVESFHSELRMFKNSSDLSTSLQILINRISTKMDEGKYKILPLKQQRNAANWHLEDDFLVSILNVSKDQTDLVISDDRFFNSFLKASDVEIYSIVELAGILRNSEFITNEEFFDLILRLRKANVRFIPPLPEEIINYLPEKVEDGETANLRTLRQYLFSCFQDKEVLLSNQGNRPPSFTYGELSFYINSVNAVNSAILSVWKSQSTVDEKIAKSELIIRTLFIDNASLSAIFRGADNIRGHLQLYAHSVIKFFLETMSSGVENRAEFYQWIEDKLIKSVTDDTEKVTKFIADLLIEHIGQVLTAMPSERLNQARFFYCQFYDDFPKGLKECVNKDNAFLKKIGILTYNVMSIENRNFRASDFFYAVRKAYQGKKTRVKCINIDAWIEVEIQDGKICFQIEENGIKSEGRYLSGEQMKLCNPDSNEVRKFVEASAMDLDLSISEMNSALLRIQSTADLEERIDIWNSLAESSYENHIKVMDEYLEKQKLSYQGIVPDVKVLQHYLRIEDVESFNSIQNITSVLTEKFGVIEAIARLAGLPTDLGNIFEKAVKDNDDNFHRNLIKRLLKECYSPMGVLHIIRLLSVEKLKGNESYIRLQNKLLRVVNSNDFFVRTDSFLTVLSWIEDRLQTSYQYRTLPPKGRTLSGWIISHKAYSQFTKFDVEPKWISEEFPKVNTPLSSFIFSKDEMLNDASYPQYITSQRLISSGLCYALNGSTPLNNSLASSLRDLCFDEKGKNRNLDLFRSVEAKTNSLESFLHLNPISCYQQLVGENESIEINRICGEWLDEQSHENKSIWVLIEMIYGRGRLPSPIQEKFFEKILKVNFVELITHDKMLGLRSFRFACFQSANEFPQELNTKLKSEALAIIKYFSRNASATSISLFENDQYIHLFLESIIKLGSISNDSIKNISSFSTLITELSREDFRLFSDFNLYIERMYWDFPLELRTHISQLISYARST